MSKYFDFNLYKEAIRQTRLTGIIFGGIIIALSLIGEIGQMMEYHRRSPMGTIRWVRTLEFMETTPMLWLFMYLAPLFLVMKLFAFMNKRSASDFYHAIPHTRKSMFVSFLTGIMTWIIGTMVLVTLLSSIVYFNSPGIIVRPSVVIVSFFGFLAGAFLVTACLMLGKGLSGTWLTNIVIGGIFLFYPRMILSIFNRLFVTITQVIQFQDSNLLANTGYNIPFSLFSPASNMGYQFPGRGTDIALGSILYTFILGAIYIGIAAVLFCRRKSETAKRGAVNKWMQHLFRCLLIFPLTLVVPNLLLDPFWRRQDTILIVLAIFASLVIYFVYELMSTRKLICLVKAIPPLGFVILANLLFALLLIVSRNGVWNNVPLADEITGVRIVTNLPRDSSYNRILTHGVYLNDPRVNQMVEQDFRGNVRQIQRGNRVSGSRLNLSIQMEDGSVMIRSLRFSDNRANHIRDIQRRDPIFLEKATRLPGINPDTAVGFTWSFDSRRWDVWDLPSVELEDDLWKQLWEIYSKEFNQLSTMEQAYHTGILSSPCEEVTSFLGYITVTGRVENQRFVSHFRLSNRTPTTIEFLVNQVDEEIRKQMMDMVE